MINYSVVMGRVQNDLVIRYTTYGLPYVRLMVLVCMPRETGVMSRVRVNCCAFGDTALKLKNEYLKKKTLVLLEGSLANLNFYDSENQRVRGLTFSVNKYVVFRGKNDEDVHVGTIFQQHYKNQGDNDGYTDDTTDYDG